MKLQDYERQHVAGLMEQRAQDDLGRICRVAGIAPPNVWSRRLPVHLRREGECVICGGDAEPCEVLTDPPLCKACKGKV